MCLDKVVLSDWSLPFLTIDIAVVRSLSEINLPYLFAAQCLRIDKIQSISLSVRTSSLEISTVLIGLVCTIFKSEFYSKYGSFTKSTALRFSLISGDEYSDFVGEVTYGCYLRAGETSLVDQSYFKVIPNLCRHCKACSYEIEVSLLP